VSLRVEPDGNGSASFTWEQVADTLADRLLQHVEDALGARAELLGLRFVDADGRNAAGPVPGGVVHVGFVATDRAAP
jgi:hypothetical protein